MDNYIQHHGVKGQRWGVRKYVDEQGNLTGLGKKKYAEKERAQKAKIESKASKQSYEQEKRLREQSARHEKARRNGRVLATAALAVIGTTLAKKVFNNITANKIKMENARALNERKGTAMSNFKPYIGVKTTPAQMKEYNNIRKGLLK